MTYDQDLTLMCLPATYTIDSKGEPEFSKEEQDYLLEYLLETIIESEEFQDNLNQYYEDENADQADREYDLRKDNAMEANWENE